MLIIVKALIVLSLTLQSGWASYYVKETTVGTILYRLSVGDIPDKKYDAYIAVSDCTRIGETGYIIIDKHDPVQYIVFDCAGRDAYTNGVSWMVANGFQAELGYYTAKQYAPCMCKTWVTLFPTHYIQQVLYARSNYHVEENQEMGIEVRSDGGGRQQRVQRFAVVSGR